jgi:hypothetical protein
MLVVPLTCVAALIHVCAVVLDNIHRDSVPRNAVDARTHSGFTGSLNLSNVQELGSHICCQISKTGCMSVFNCQM